MDQEEEGTNPLFYSVWILIVSGVSSHNHIYNILFTYSLPILMIPHAITILYSYDLILLIPDSTMIHHEQHIIICILIYIVRGEPSPSIVTIRAQRVSRGSNL